MQALKEANERIAAVKLEEDRIAVLEELHRVFPEFALIYRVSENADAFSEVKGHALSVIGAIEKAKARLLWPRAEDL